MRNQAVRINDRKQACATQSAVYSGDGTDVRMGRQTCRVSSCLISTPGATLLTLSRQSRQMLTSEPSERSLCMNPKVGCSSSMCEHPRFAPISIPLRGCFCLPFAESCSDTLTARKPVASTHHTDCPGINPQQSLVNDLARMTFTTSLHLTGNSMAPVEFIERGASRLGRVRQSYGC